MTPTRPRKSPASSSRATASQTEPAEDVDLPATALATTDLLSHAPFVPATILAQLHCAVSGDPRYRRAARAQQALWARSLGLEPGLHQHGGRHEAESVPLGSLLRPADAARGVNFISSQVYQHFHQELVWRETGAIIGVKRALANLLSSETLTRNLLAPLAHNLDLASAVFAHLLPALVRRVDRITFEATPGGRHNPDLLRDATAADAVIHATTPEAESILILIEVKYTEGGGARSVIGHRPHLDAVSRAFALHQDPDAPILRTRGFEQLWRLLLLAQGVVRAGNATRSHLVLLAPRSNAFVTAIGDRYRTELRDPVGSGSTAGFTPLALDSFVTAIAAAGAHDPAAYLHRRYLDWGPVLDQVLDREGLSRLSETDTVSLLPTVTVPAASTQRTRRSRNAKPVTGRAGSLRSGTWTGE
ncbi:hypothetical protein MKK69_08150 [Methylobacterium sp. J-026]|uniref:PGN_0703 family putative restriction endonuclease n=1 Tax=Methylobacterium sp. J-026 TaxID=2836624 RepID=UPI001FB9BE20|nr:hypothetical protein [Methylobacterium sp. J-026]MCJ2134037.1 hypothetical protein [Methylobacterium sp. J-026]